MNKCNLKTFYELLTAPMNIPQSMVLPPFVFDAIYNTVSGWLQGRCAALYPKDQMLVDMVEPFLRSVPAQVKQGTFSLPAEYRNFFDMGAFVNEAFSSPCDGLPVSDEVKERQYKSNINKGGCVRQAIRLVDSSEWDYLTKDSFDYPTLEQPIAKYVGKKQLTICPSEITTVEVRYMVSAKMYRYGYIMQPDDTFIYDPATSEESEWPDAAFDYLYKGCSILFGAYLRDNNISQFATLLNDVEFK